MTDHIPAPAPDAPIVAAVDGSATSHLAVAWAAADAALHGCRLHLIISQAFQFAYGPAPFVTAEAVDQLQDAGEQIVAEAARIAHDTVPGDDLAISTEVIFDPIIPSLIARSQRARTLVVGSRGRGGFRRAVLGSVSSAVVHHAHCPVAVIHAMSGTDAVSSRKPVLVGVDGSPDSVPAIELAFEEASLRKVGLIALHSWSDATSAEREPADWESIRDSEDALLAESLADHSEQYPDVPVRRVLVRDQPAHSLLAESENAQLVVVGSHGRGGFAGMLLGSTSSALVQSVECPIIVARTPPADHHTDRVGR
ncbi:universal stress protein [Nocardia aurantiaca]|uniref:Universal stress protein n=1 Tax=Nocardia aurantiaca TaxID=2675850 RepID=A0A6I3L5W1_9NOCA|nr:universal stress protein [Nocardia aurantiaca]MTE16054.1 universal stress protein [Nocardia aurantiaca]